MNRRKITILLTSMFLLASSGNGQQRSYPFSLAHNVPGKIDPSHFEFSSADYSYSISRFGRGIRKGGQTLDRSFSLRLDRDVYLTHFIYHAQYEGDLLLICEITDDLNGAGFISRLNGRTLRVKWKKAIPVFNVGQGLVDGKYAYVTGLGFIGKVDLNSGSYVWRHRNLYDRTNSAFNSFELPEVQGTLVIFRESSHYLRKKVAVIKVERTSGKVISIDD